MVLRASREWKVRPSEFAKWPIKDQVSAIALLQHESSIGRCGHSHRNTIGDLEGWFEVKTDGICWACAALEEYERDNAEGRQPGSLLRVVDTRTSPEE